MTPVESASVTLKKHRKKPTYFLDCFAPQKVNDQNIADTQKALSPRYKSF